MCVVRKKGETQSNFGGDFQRIYFFSTRGDGGGANKLGMQIYESGNKFSWSM